MGLGTRLTGGHFMRFTTTKITIIQKLLDVIVCTLHIIHIISVAWLPKNFTALSNELVSKMLLQVLQLPVLFWIMCLLSGNGVTIHGREEEICVY